MSPHPHKDEAEGRFSALFFVRAIVLSLLGLFAALWLVSPTTFKIQFEARPMSLLATFVSVHMACAFVEYFFHRYVLHKPFPFLTYFYKQHTLHHALTRIAPLKPRTGAQPPAEVTVVNKYPITEEEQHEASFFPWYSLLVFAAFGTPFFVIAQRMWPEAPVFLGGYLAIAWSLTLYELLHAFEHKPADVWEPLFEHPKFGKFWRIFYQFHEGHHAMIEANESISGFFGLPITDWIFGTWVKPATLYAHGTKVPLEAFEPPKPRLPIRILDRFVQTIARTRRSFKPA
jgi:hemolysin III